MRPWKNRESFGAVSEITMVKRAITRINSISVKPRRAGRANRAVLPLPGCPLKHVIQRLMVQLPITMLSPGGPSELMS